MFPAIIPLIDNFEVLYRKILIIAVFEHPKDFNVPIIFSLSNIRINKVFDRLMMHIMHIIIRITIIFLSNNCTQLKIPGNRSFKDFAFSL
tara:strand:- start:40 stop:309 length:270 start_codon:yes stop_codon:yes gene_type:complete